MSAVSLQRRSVMVPRTSAAKPRRRNLQASAQAPASVAGIKVQGKHMDLTPAIEEYAQKKVAHAIQSYQSAVNAVDVKLSSRGAGDASKGGKLQTMEVTIRTARHGVIRAEETRENLYASIDVASDKISRSLRKMKEKAVKRGQWPGRGYAKGATGLKDVNVDEDLGRLSMDEPTDDEIESATSRLGVLPESVKRTKVFYLDAMSVQDAIDQLDQVDHDFFLYLDRDSGHVQAVYKRQAGGHGVIITIPDEITV